MLQNGVLYYYEANKFANTPRWGLALTSAFSNFLF